MLPSAPCHSREADRRGLSRPVAGAALSQRPGPLLGAPSPLPTGRPSCSAPGALTVGSSWCGSLYRIPQSGAIATIIPSIDLRNSEVARFRGPGVAVEGDEGDHQGQQDGPQDDQDDHP